MTDRYDNTRVAKIRAAYNDLRVAIRSGDIEAAERALDRYEPWANYAAAFKAAAKIAEKHRAAYHGRSPLNSISAVADERMATAAGAIYVEICALTPDDASAALNAMLKAERAKAYEAAALLAAEYPASTHGCLSSDPFEAAEMAAEEIAAAIRALAQEDE